MLTRKMKKTPPIERPCFVPCGFWLFKIPSQINATVIPMVPHRRGFRRPTRSRMKIMKIKSRELSLRVRTGISNLLGRTMESNVYHALTRKRSDAVVDPRDQDGLPTGEAQGFVHNNLIITYHICSFHQHTSHTPPEKKLTYTSHLGENLHSNSVQQPRPPLRNPKHGHPTGNRDGLLCSNRGTDFIKLGLDPSVIVTVIMELSQDSHSVVLAIRGH